jgi:hypothetical protein
MCMSVFTCICVCMRVLAMYSKAQAQIISKSEFKLLMILQGIDPELGLFMLRYVKYLTSP